MRKIKRSLVSILFVLAFLASLSAASTQCVWTGVEKIVAVGDIHGDYKNFIRILKGTQLIDEELHWIGGKTHLVQIGDIMDRGPEAKKAFDLIRSLEKEAKEAGGEVHLLIGNHEMMNITGITFDYPDYVTVQQFFSFLPEYYRKQKNNEYRKQSGKEIPKDAEIELSLNTDFRAFWIKILRNDKAARQEYISFFNDKYGKWICDHNVVIKINDIIFVHGGISKKYSTMRLDEINDKFREELNYFRLQGKFSRHFEIPLNPEYIYDPDGPIWYRDLARNDESLFKEDVDEILTSLKARDMVIGHTEQSGSPVLGDLSRFQNRIWTIDTGISDIFGGNLSALVIDKGNFSIWGPNNEK